MDCTVFHSNAVHFGLCHPFVHLQSVEILDTQLNMQKMVNVTPMHSAAVNGDKSQLSKLLLGKLNVIQYCAVSGAFVEV